MPTDADARAQAEASLDALANLVFRRDPAVVFEFTDDALVFGSERGKIAAGRAQLQSFFQQIFARSTRFSWAWDQIRASATDELCWFLPEGVVTTNSERPTRAPYRLSGVLRRVQRRWMWHQFHGSEPAWLIIRRQLFANDRRPSPVAHHEVLTGEFDRPVRSNTR